MDLKNARNQLVQRMSAADRDRLSSQFAEEEMDFKQILHDQGQPVDDVYFVEAGVMSLVTELADGEVIETGTVGSEGLVGLPAVLGVRHSGHRALCQIPGRALRVPADVIAAESEQGTTWFRLLLRYANFVNFMNAQVAACNRTHQVDARMSRWLLMTHDRVDGDEFPLTQEFLGQMLGVARPTVNIAGATLQRAGFIEYTRGRITVLDRKGLESASCECYRRVRDELANTLGGGVVRGRAAAKR
jgi:CRP-like cAMP-binding protein